MSKAIEVFVTDQNNNGLAGQKVKLYGGKEVVTDRSGKATLVADGAHVDVYVNRVTAYSGPVSSVTGPIHWKVG